MSSNLPIPIGHEDIVYSGKTFEVIHQKIKVGNKGFTLEIAKRSPGVRFIIVSIDKKILLPKEFRLDLQAWDTRLPGGKVFDSLSEYKDFLKSEKDIVEKAKSAAIKEAREETGIIVDEIKYFSTSNSGLTVRWDLLYFVISKFHQNPKGQELDLGENIKLEWVEFEKVKEKCLNGEITEDRSAAVLLRFLNT